MHAQNYNMCISDVVLGVSEFPVRISCIVHRHQLIRHERRQRARIAGGACGPCAAAFAAAALAAGALLAVPAGAPPVFARLSAEG